MVAAAAAGTRLKPTQPYRWGNSRDSNKTNNDKNNDNYCNGDSNNNNNTNNNNDSRSPA